MLLVIAHHGFDGETTPWVRLSRSVLNNPADYELSDTRADIDRTSSELGIADPATSAKFDASSHTTFAG